MKKRRLSKVLVILPLVLTLGASLPAGDGGDEFKSKGPSKLSLLRKSLDKELGVYAWGIWPGRKAFEKSIRGPNLKSEYTNKIKTWLRIVLNKELLPPSLDSKKWHGIGRFHRLSSILGQFHSPKQRALVQFYATGIDLGITATSEKRFGVDVSNITDAKIVQMMTKLLNYPEDKVAKIVINKKHTIEVETDGDSILVCCGLLTCDGFDPNIPGDRENIQTWWNCIFFWIIDGTISIHTTTVPWETWPANPSEFLFKFESQKDGK